MRAGHFPWERRRAITLKATDSLLPTLSPTPTLPGHSRVTIVPLDCRDTQLVSKTLAPGCHPARSPRAAVSLLTLPAASPMMRTPASLQPHLVFSLRTPALSRLQGHNPETLLRPSTNRHVLLLSRQKEVQVTGARLITTRGRRHILATLP